MSRLDPDEYLRVLELETARMAAVDASMLPLDVHHLEGWTVHSVVGHTGWIFRYVSQCLNASPDDKPSRSAVGEPPVGDDVLGWFAEAVELFHSAWAGVEIDDIRPSWTGPQPASWWLRRTAHEVAIHRWDAYAASAQPDPIDTDQARDAIEEVLEVFTPHRLQFDLLNGSGETIHLHATDADNGEWLLRLDPDEVEWERAHAKGDVAARGTMSDLLLLLWSRIPPARLEVFGDATLLERWQQAATF